jgi:hypothetical protein
MMSWKIKPIITHLSWCRNQNALIQIGTWIQELLGMWLDLLIIVGLSIIKSVGRHCHSITKKSSILFNHDSKIKQVENVFFVLGVSKNILFVGSIIDKGCYILFSAKKCWVLNSRNSAKMLAEGYQDQTNGLYKLLVC